MYFERWERKPYFFVCSTIKRQELFILSFVLTVFCCFLCRSHWLFPKIMNYVSSLQAMFFFHGIKAGNPEWALYCNNYILPLQFCATAFCLLWCSKVNCYQWSKHIFFLNTIQLNLLSKKYVNLPLSRLFFC